MGADEGFAKGRWAGHGAGSGLQGVHKGGQRGIIEEYNGGTIFVDELHRVPRWFQAFLLQVLDGQPISRASGTGESILPNVRLIFASNRSLAELETEIEHDLLDRLRRYIVDVPALKDRKEDILTFVNKGLTDTSWDRRFVLALLRYDWPGNVRELNDALEYARNHAGGSKITLDHLKLEDPTIKQEVLHIEAGDVEREVFRCVESMLRNRGLEKGEGLQNEIAKLLSVSQSTVSRRLQGE